MRIISTPSRRSARGDWFVNLASQGRSPNVPLVLLVSALFSALTLAECDQAGAQSNDEGRWKTTNRIESGALGATSGPDATNHRGAIGGLVVNGTDHSQPLAGAEVVLRRVDPDGITPIGTTTTDEHGHFAFLGLPADQETWYVPGVNRDGVHYPGPRVPITRDTPAIRVRLTAYDGLTEPSPLVALRHVIQAKVNAADQTLQISESIRVANPSPRGYVGRSKPGESPVTLTLRPMAGFERVVFADEFLARSFQIRDGALTTDLPWPPGSREITISYELPITGRTQKLNKPLDLPCGDVQVEVLDIARNSVSAHIVPEDANSDTAHPVDGPSASDYHLAYQGAALPQGHPVELTLSSLPVSPLSYAKWIAIAALGVGIGLAALRLRPRTKRIHGADGHPHEGTRKNKLAA